MSSIDARRSVYLTLLYCYSIDDLAARQHSLNTQRVMMELPQKLHVVQQDIMVCHNNIDTFLAPDFRGLSGVAELIRKLEDTVSSSAARQVAVEERIGLLENRMAGVEGKLDEMLRELKAGMEVLLGRRS